MVRNTRIVRVWERVGEIMKFRIANSRVDEPQPSIRAVAAFRIPLLSQADLIGYREVACSLVESVACRTKRRLQWK